MSLMHLPHIMGIKLAHPVTDDDNFDLIGADYYWTFMEDQVISSLVWPDPWIGPCALIKGLVTLRYITCASTTIVVEPIKLCCFIK